MAAAPQADGIAVSVVLPVRNAAGTIDAQLEGLSNQEGVAAWELLVVDNGCTDDTLDVVERWRHRLPAVGMVDARATPGLASARDAGAAAARGEIIAFCDGDDVVDACWLQRLSGAFTDADMVSGHLDVRQLNPSDVIYWRGGGPTDDGLKLAHGYLPHAVGANFAIRRSVYLAVGGCDQRFRICSDDVDLSWRVQESGHTLAFAPDAVVHYRLRSELRDALRQQWMYGRAEALLYRKFRPRMHRQPIGEVLREWLFLVTRIHQVFRGRRLRGRWLSVAAYRVGRLRGSIEQRVLWW